MKQVTIVVPNGYADLGSIRGSFEILTTANEYWVERGNKSMINVRIAGFVAELKLDTGFFSIHPADIKEIRKTGLIIIPSVSNYYGNIVERNKDLIDWIKEQYQNGAEVASICTGAFLLAGTGLLDGKICSTHWGAASDFRRMFPNVNLQIDKLITSQQGIYTNGGSYSFLNLILFFVEKYFDRPTAVFCSKMFQIDMDRTSQSPFVIFQSQKKHGDEVIFKAQTYLEENLKEKISFEQLASKLAVSRRNFDRRFIKATGNTPVEYLQRVKVEVAKSTLEKGRNSVFEVMNEVTGISPLDYKAKFTKQTDLK
jgi:transcriptional regulator GlxA family with amidase domain